MSTKNHNYYQNILIGAATAVSILGSLTAWFYPKKHHKVWTEKAKDVAHHVIGKSEVFNKNIVLGSVVGSVIGATAALLLAPKSGSELLKDLSHPFSHQGRHSRSSSHKKSSHVAKAKHKSAHHHNSHPKSSKKKNKNHSSKRSTGTTTIGEKVLNATEKAAHALKS